MSQGLSLLWRRRRRGRVRITAPTAEERRGRTWRRGSLMMMDRMGMGNEGEE